MSDPLVQLGANPTARKLVKSLGLPIPMPQKLRRDPNPWRERPLADRSVIVGGFGDLEATIATILTRAGANPIVADGTASLWQDAGEAWGRPAQFVAVEDLTNARPHAIVFDATGFTTPEELKALWVFFKPRLRSLRKSGRVVVIGRPHGSQADVLAASTQRALEGFVRSVGKEIGRKGATSLLVTVAEGAEDRLSSVLRFFLSDHSAYVTGQVIRVTNDVSSTPRRDVQALEGKVALVTGAAQGIGAATARTLAREGAKVIVLDRPADEAKAHAVAMNVGGIPLLADVTDDDAAEIIAAFVKTHFGALDIVIHNAGVTRDKTLSNMKEAWWDQTLGVNLVAVHRMNEALEPLLAEGARVTCLSSIAGIAGNVGQTNYAASKAGVIGLVEALGAKLAPRGIAVNAVAPGFIETRMTAEIPLATREGARRLSSLSQGGIPLDVAEVLTFLSTPGASALSGQVVRVCGGNFIGA